MIEQWSVTLIVKRMGIVALLVLGYLTPVLAETQMELNKGACDEFQQSDNKLNKIYQQILVKYHDDSVFIKQFVTAQKKWMEFRDAYIASRYVPQYKDTYGSILPMCTCYFIKDITDDRIKQLRVWIDGVEEGDACIGSVNN